MIKVYVKKTSSYPVSAPKIKRVVKDFLKEKGIVSDAEISIAIVGEEKMRKISKKYLKDNSVHNVLSFTESEIRSKFKYPPKGLIQLGEVVLCYPKIAKEANVEDRRIDYKVEELVKHGILHLLGIHHS